MHKSLKKEKKSLLLSNQKWMGKWKVVITVKTILPSFSFANFEMSFNQIRLLQYLFVYQMTWFENQF